MATREECPDEHVLEHLSGLLGGDDHECEEVIIRAPEYRDVPRTPAGPPWYRESRARDWSWPDDNGG